MRPARVPIGLQLTQASRAVSRAFDDALATAGGSLPVWISAPFAVVGFVLAWRKPGNRLGWIFFGLAVCGTVAQDASFYVVACYRVRHGTLPFGWVALLVQPAWSIAVHLRADNLLWPLGQPEQSRKVIDDALVSASGPVSHRLLAFRAVQLAVEARRRAIGDGASA